VSEGGASSAIICWTDRYCNSQTLSSVALLGHMMVTTNTVSMWSTGHFDHREDANFQR
jgi:hypothetical protein